MAVHLASTSMASLGTLPSGVREMICTYLNLRDLLRLARTCRNWRRSVQNLRDLRASNVSLAEFTALSNLLLPSIVSMKIDVRQYSKRDSDDTAKFRGAVARVGKLTSLRSLSISWRDAYTEIFQDLESLPLLEVLHLDFFPTYASNISVTSAPSLWAHLKELTVLGNVYYTLPQEAFLLQLLETKQLRSLKWKNLAKPPVAAEGKLLQVNLNLRQELRRMHDLEEAYCQNIALTLALAPASFAFVAGVHCVDILAYRERLLSKLLTENKPFAFLAVNIGYFELAAKRHQEISKILSRGMLTMELRQSLIGETTKNAQRGLLVKSLVGTVPLSDEEEFKHANNLLRLCK